MDEPVQPGEILAKKYRVEKVLGIGGMGVVVSATHLELDQKVALKFMHANAYATEEAKNRFQREARIASKLRSEHVARVSDTGVLENGAPYIVMEYLDGVDLSAQLQQFGPMPVGYAAECIVQACDAIGEAHSHGIVHRDLKPANLFLTQHSDGSPLVKVLDFGISKATGADTGMAMTKTGALLGSPLYMSPEQMRSLKTVDARTDIWAIGVILFELLTAHTPFTADSFGDLLLQVMTTTPKPLRQLRPDVPPEVSALVERCLTKDPAARVQSVAEIATVLAPFCSASGVVLAQRITTLAHRSGTGDPRVTTRDPPRATLEAATAPGPSAAAAGAGTNAGWGGTGAPEAPPRSTAALWIGVAVLLACGVTFAVVAITKRASPAESTATSAATPSASAVTATASAPVVSTATAAATTTSVASPATGTPPLPSATEAVAAPPPPPPAPIATTSRSLGKSPSATPSPVVPAAPPPSPQPPTRPATTAAHPPANLLDTSQ